LKAATAFWLGIAMIAFAANSLLCRIALGEPAIDAVSFTSLRLASGALVLALLHVARGGWRAWRLDAPSALALYGYAILFSLAYLELTAGTGALLLFAAVQLTMLGHAIARGERPSPRAWAGIALALVGLVWLLMPGLTMPSPRSAVLMLGAGVAWGVYSLRGARGGDPVATTTWNFVAAALLAVLVSAAVPVAAHHSTRGVIAAVLSGTCASALGYVVWYRVLPSLSGLVAATAQLSVPLLAALGGVLVLGEALSPRLAVSGLLILGGIGLVARARLR